MYIVIKVLINVNLLVNELCEYQNVRCNDKKMGVVVFSKTLGTLCKTALRFSQEI